MLAGAPDGDLAVIALACMCVFVSNRHAYQGIVMGVRGIAYELSHMVYCDDRCRLKTRGEGQSWS
jgi:hypothetical protein